MPDEAPPGAGHNSKKATPVSEEEIKAGGVAVERLRNIVSRIENLETEKKDLSSDIRDIYAEAKSAGFEPKVLRELIRLRKKDPSDLEELESQLDVYRHALNC